MKRGQFLTRQQIELAETFTKALLLSGRSGLAVAGDGAVDEIITLVVDGSDRRGGGHVASILGEYGRIAKILYRQNVFVYLKVRV